MTSTFSKLLPTLNRILVKQVKPEAKTASGIILQAPEDKSLYGEIVEVGPGQYENGKLVPVAVQKGQTVLLPDYGGQKVKLSTGEFYIYRDVDVLGILQNK